MKSHARMRLGSEEARDSGEIQGWQTGGGWGRGGVGGGGRTRGSSRAFERCVPRAGAAAEQLLQPQPTPNCSTPPYLHHPTQRPHNNFIGQQHDPATRSPQKACITQTLVSTPVIWGSVALASPRRSIKRRPRTEGRRTVEIRA